MVWILLNNGTLTLPCFQEVLSFLIISPDHGLRVLVRKQDSTGLRSSHAEQLEWQGRFMEWLGTVWFCFWSFNQLAFAPNGHVWSRLGSVSTVIFKSCLLIWNLLMNMTFSKMLQFYFLVTRTFFIGYPKKLHRHDSSFKTLANLRKRSISRNISNLGLCLSNQPSINEKRAIIVLHLMERKQNQNKIGEMKIRAIFVEYLQSYVYFTRLLSEETTLHTLMMPRYLTFSESVTFEDFVRIPIS